MNNKLYIDATCNYSYLNENEVFEFEDLIDINISNELYQLNYATATKLIKKFVYEYILEYENKEIEVFDVYINSISYNNLEFYF